ncbi:MAG TPA: methylated-DNA--[protein]-cysteine S-methyltransferase [Solirubrobacteraceae bacterium]
MPDNTHQDAGVERLLRSGAETAVPDWIAVHARFTARALSDDLVDVAYEDHDTPLGMMRVSATNTGIVRMILPAEDAEEVLEDLARKVSARILRTSTPAITQTREELDEYFDGHRHRFNVPLDWTLAKAFRLKVLEATAQIPYGHTASYRQVASAAGSPNAVRAAGSALATNPLPVLVPCHRVLRSDGTIGQYLGGPAAKTQLLTLEQAI